MSYPVDDIDKMLHDVANDMRIPNETAQMLLRIAVQLSRQRAQLTQLDSRIAELQEQTVNSQERHSSQIADLRRQIQRLSGIHGA